MTLQKKRDIGVIPRMWGKKLQKNKFWQGGGGWS